MQPALENQVSLGRLAFVQAVFGKEDADLLAERRLVCRRINVTQTHCTGRGVRFAQQQIEQRCLSTARRADHRRNLTGMHGQRGDIDDGRLVDDFL